MHTTLTTAETLFYLSMSIAVIVLCSLCATILYYTARVFSHIEWIGNITKKFSKYIWKAKK